MDAPEGRPGFVLPQMEKSQANAQRVMVRWESISTADPLLTGYPCLLGGYSRGVGKTSGGLSAVVGKRFRPTDKMARQESGSESSTERTAQCGQSAVGHSGAALSSAWSWAQQGGGPWSATDAVSAGALPMASKARRMMRETVVKRCARMGQYSMRSIGVSQLFPAFFRIFRQWFRGWVRVNPYSRR
jgi:hypothetical protein